MKTVDTEQFYPTPKNTVEQCLKDHIHSNRYFPDERSLRGLYGPYIDPHGGEGAFLDVLAEYGVRLHNLYAYEINPQRRQILMSKGYRVLGGDFKSDWEDLQFHTWLCNPPWREDAKQMLLVWERFSWGHIFCLMRSANYNTPRTADQVQWANIVSGLVENGQAEVSELGPCFEDAERKTKEEAVFIKIHVEQKDCKIFDEARFEFDNVTADPEFSPDTLIRADVIQRYVDQYNAARRALTARYKAEKELSFYLKGVASPYFSHKDKNGNKCDSTDETESSRNLGVVHTLETDLQVLKQRFWHTIYAKAQISQRAPKHFKDKFDDFAYANAQLAFTKSNILEMMLTFSMNAEQLMHESIEKLFDKLTKYSSKNITETKTWKTNHSFKVKSKVIIPKGIPTFVYTGNLGFDWQPHYNKAFYDDLDKIWAYLEGINFENIGEGETLYESICHHLSRDCAKHYSEKGESKYFEFKCHKSKTLHIWFKNPELLKRFNQIAAAQKKWIDSYEAESCADQRERDQARKGSDHVKTTSCSSRPGKQPLYNPDLPPGLNSQLSLL